MKKYLLISLLLAGCISNKPSARIEFEAPDAYPEGVAYDKTADVFYVSSMRTGTVGKVTRQGQYTALHTDSSFKSSYGMKMHPDGKRLYVCVGDANYSKYTAPDTRRKMARLVSIDPASGKRLSDIDLSGLVPGKHFPNDLVFDDKGNIYLTDSFAHAIYKITPEGKASVFAKDKRFETEGIGLNGIVYHPDGFLLVDNSNTGMIYKVDIAHPKNVQKVVTDQYFLGADGLLLNDSNTLTVVVNGGNDKIYQLTTEDHWKSARLSATTLITDRFTYPATAALAGKEIWVMNAGTNELVDSNAVPAKKFAIQFAPLKSIPKKLAGR
ncbi:SMP-30/gluconolactonase/LRE family protein [Runella slithyformis]|uniref:SMP-30/Gluconolaconase/LRE-like region-containing protein n=1 Tax=Runella slithyformis (strain ATCC 29530 / DSM 19594 / LMG 11500 / NCIMB 11436 / LSU 4) TaxID=761193 RepID=A0A7U3ZP49_RUNSL|nr:SMP-30/gluconolactonase/LRE family protein [Runella slithyformis]AEI50792.1 SMP-30/Gluconolaconase/LRE-like region-containing protein [Runella slithyformis DSM 19594]